MNILSFSTLLTLASTILAAYLAFALYRARSNLARLIATRNFQRDRIAFNTARESDSFEILSSISEGVVAIDDKERLMFINPPALMMLDYKQSAFSRQNFSSIDPSGRLISMVRDILRKGVQQRREVFVPGSADRLVEIIGNRLESSNIFRSGVVLVLKDITHSQRLENVRREFVANVSHELRTPITSIQGFVETLLDGAVDDPAVRENFLEIVLHQSKRLRTIVDDLLTLARLENFEQGTELITEVLVVRDLLTSAAQFCASFAEEKQVSLEVPDCGALTVEANRLLLEQAVINLIFNGIKYNKPGGSVILLTEADGKTVHISVVDDGVGIAPQHIPRLFERFYRVDKARSRQDGGSGLGLSIVKHIAAVHDGSVGVRTELQEGSRFTISLPHSRELPNSQPTEAEPTEMLAVGQ